MGGARRRDHLSGKQTGAALLVSLLAFIGWCAGTAKNATSPPEKPKTPEQLEDERWRAANLAEVARVRARLAAAPNARTVRELGEVLGRPTCMRGFKTLNPGVYFHDVDGYVVRFAPTKCAEGLNFYALDQQFQCERYPKLWDCDVRGLLEAELQEIVKSNR